MAQFVTSNARTHLSNEHYVFVPYQCGIRLISILRRACSGSLTYSGSNHSTEERQIFGTNVCGEVTLHLRALW